MNRHLTILLALHQDNHYHQAADREHVADRIEADGTIEQDGSGPRPLRLEKKNSNQDG